MSLSVNQFVRVFAGSFVLISLALGVEGSPLFVSSKFLWFTAFVGANLLQSGFTRFCPLENILRKFGVKGGPACGLSSCLEAEGHPQPLKLPLRAPFTPR